MESPNEYRHRIIQDFDTSLISGNCNIVKILTESFSKSNLCDGIVGEISFSNIGTNPNQTLWMLSSMRDIYERKGWNVRFIFSNVTPNDHTFYTDCRDVTDLNINNILTNINNLYFSISE